MYDRRVVRGSTYANYPMPTVSILAIYISNDLTFVCSFNEKVAQYFIHYELFIFGMPSCRVKL